MVSMMDSSHGDDGGYKYVYLEVRGDSVYSKLKWEAGVHRVQCLPATETKGRVYTPTATVAIMVSALERPSPPGLGDVSNDDQCHRRQEASELNEPPARRRHGHFRSTAMRPHRPPTPFRRR